MKKQIRALDFSGIEKFIVSVKGQNVIVDSDVASIYGVLTKEVNQAVKNNPEKFPSGYIVEADKDQLVKTFDRFKNLKHSTAQSKAFTEKGLYMLATILRSPQATAATIAIDLPVSGTETTLEINFAVMKFKHTIKKENKKGTTNQ